jgi:ppGpp synthetase/RelA/SpoT-type nucleotidyltranferase
MAQRLAQMKVIKKIRDIHSESEERYKRLAEEVQGFLKGEAEKRGWFFISRLKGLESFALKIETGRVPDPSKMEDFFACTIVVPTLSHIETAETLVLEHYDVLERRPPVDAQTFKQASNFQFDDLRLYVAKRASQTGKNVDLDGAIFEIQAKTVLQHAWGLATHDLIYKSDTVSWPRERIAYQVKAMLEHAEIAIAEANRLADAPAVAKKDERTAEILKLIEQIRALWSPDRLPKDIKRLAETTQHIFKSCKLDVKNLAAMLDAEKQRLGMLPNDISPYAFIVQALAHSGEFDFRAALSRAKRLKILVHEGMDLPSWMKDDNAQIVRV